MCSFPSEVRFVDWRGFIEYCSILRRSVGARPALPYSSISSFSTNRVNIIYGTLMVEYGWYPQQAASAEMQTVLESLYDNDSLLKTGNKYTTDSRKFTDYENGFDGQEHIEYEYNGKRYVRVKVNSCFDGKLITLSNGQQYKDGDYVWIEVSPIKWLVDKENDIAISKEILFSGIQFNDRQGDYKNFKDTVYYWYLNTYFIKEIMNYKNRKNESTENESIEELLNQFKELIIKQETEIATLKRENARKTAALTELKKVIRNNINTKKTPVKVRTNKKK